MPSRPQPCQPPLSAWSYAWRFAAAAVISGLAWSDVVVQQWQDHRGLFWLDIVLGLAAFVLFPLYRRHPVGVAVTISVLSAFSGLAAGPAILTIASLATRRVWWEVGLIGVVSVAAGQAFATIQPTSYGDEPYWLNLTINTIITIAVISFGMYVGSRRELMSTLRERAERAEAERDLRVGKARGDERARIAREMHDVLAHKISQVSMHAGALTFRDDLSADEMRDSAGVIQRQANEALTELRSVLGVLRDPGTGELLDRPQPTYADVAGLVADARASGMHVDHEDLLPRDTVVPEPVGRTVFRIVQEGLTNARKHAPGTTVFVRVSGSPADGIEVLVRNPFGFGTAATPGAGLGLVGLAERTGLSGGRLEHGRDGSMFVLRGWIPWEA